MFNYQISFSLMEDLLSKADQFDLILQSSTSMPEDFDIYWTEGAV